MKEKALSLDGRGLGEGEWGQALIQPVRTQ
jgi:hypothetical protein